MYRVLVFGMTENPGGVESFLINYYRKIDREKIQFDFLCCGYFLENSRSKRVNEKMGFTFYKNVIHRTRYGVDKKTALNVLYNNSE